MWGVRRSALALGGSLARQVQTIATASNTDMCGLPQCAEILAIMHSWISSATAPAAAAVVQRSVEAFESEKLGLESDNAALRKALHSLEVRHMQQQQHGIVVAHPAQWLLACTALRRAAPCSQLQ